MTFESRLALVLKRIRAASAGSSPIQTNRLGFVAGIAFASLAACEWNDDPHEEYAVSNQAEYGSWSSYVECHQECDTQVRNCQAELPNETFCGDWYHSCLELCEINYGIPVEATPVTTALDPESSEESSDADVDPACFSMHVTCIERASSVIEIDACEALFQHCATAEQCDQECEVVCPDPVVEACLDDYEGCISAATSSEHSGACAVTFDACTYGANDTDCLPAHDPGALDLCLDQHALCVECIQSADDLHVCREIFQSCVAPTHEG